MYSRPIVPKDFVVPERLACDGFHLRMLSVDDVVKDFDAVIASRQNLKGLMSPIDDWPEGLTLKENLIDLGWHQREFTQRHSFAYTVMAADESQCLGCCYIYPSARQGYEVEAFYWARGDAAGAGLEPRLGRAFRDWLERDWPFRGVAFPGRDISWRAWAELPPSACFSAR
jgi:hypothetical protein